jgi:hypothetical protein
MKIILLIKFVWCKNFAILFFCPCLCCNLCIPSYLPSSRILFHHSSFRPSRSKLLYFLFAVIINFYSRRPVTHLLSLVYHQHSLCSLLSLMHYLVYSEHNKYILCKSSPSEPDGYSQLRLLCLVALLCCRSAAVSRLSV